MGHTYNNPPLVEALCEFQFQPLSAWDIAIPGIIYDKVQSSFPIRRQVNRFTLDLAMPGDASPKLGASPLTQFWSADEKSLVQIGEYILTINHLKPYPSWSTFFPMIKDIFTVYAEVVAPVSFRSITLRYINRVEFDASLSSLNDYFEFRPYISPDLPQAHGPFTVAIQFPYESGRDVLHMQLASLTGDSATDRHVMNLDLAYNLREPNTVTPDNVFPWIDTAHRHIEEAFEASISNILKEKFEEVPE